VGIRLVVVKFRGRVCAVVDIAGSRGCVDLRKNEIGGGGCEVGILRYILS
jgi:hypothetical protein